MWLFVAMLVVKVMGRREWFRALSSPLEVMDSTITIFSAFIWVLNTFA